MALTKERLAKIQKRSKSRKNKKENHRQEKLRIEQKFQLMVNKYKNTLLSPPTPDIFDYREFSYEEALDLGLKFFYANSDVFCHYKACKAKRCTSKENSKRNDVFLISKYFDFSIQPRPNPAYICRSCAETMVKNSNLRKYPDSYKSISPEWFFKTEYQPISFEIFGPPKYLYQISKQNLTHLAFYESLNTSNYQPPAPVITNMLDRVEGTHAIKQIRISLQAVFRYVLQKQHLYMRTPFGYTVGDLKYHIEMLFDKQMHWNLQGYKIPAAIGWSLDHVVSVRFLVDYGITYPELVNSLYNLQPLNTRSNIVKKDFVLKSDLYGYIRNVLNPFGLKLNAGWEKDERLLDEPIW
jgi:hypothetical protein